MLSTSLVDAYLNRLGIEESVLIDANGLAQLHEAHLRAVPFENLSVHIPEPIRLDENALVLKLLSGRGGFCYELNGAFAALLEALGFQVSRLGAQVFSAGKLGIPLGHLALRVDLVSPWLADVGFGENFLRPLRLDTEGVQTDPTGTYVVAAGPDGFTDLIADGEPQYRFSSQPRQLSEFEDGAHHHSTSPDSHFTHNTVCTLVTATGRITLKDRTLVTTTDGVRVEEQLEDAAVLAAYWEHFGIDFDRIP